MNMQEIKIETKFYHGSVVKLADLLDELFQKYTKVQIISGFSGVHRKVTKYNIKVNRGEKYSGNERCFVVEGKEYNNSSTHVGGWTEIYVQ